MIDLHCHILPGLDDGARTQEQSVQMARMAAESGVRIIAATPHTNLHGIFENYASPTLDQIFAALQQRLLREQIPIELVIGAEIFCNGNVSDLLRRGTLRTLGGTRYPLVEFAFSDHPDHVFRQLRQLLDAGYIPIVAHPERYYFVQHDRHLLWDFAEMGCVLQVNKGSPLGRFGSAPRRISHYMLERGLVHILASDAHSDTARTPYLADVRRFLMDFCGDGCPQLLLERNPAHILHDEPVESVFDLTGQGADHL